MQVCYGSLVVSNSAGVRLSFPHPFDLRPQASAPVASWALLLVGSTPHFYILIVNYDAWILLDL